MFVHYVRIVIVFAIGEINILLLLLSISGAGTGTDAVRSISATSRIAIGRRALLLQETQ